MKTIPYEYDEEKDKLLTLCPYDLKKWGVVKRVGGFACHHCSYFVKDTDKSVMCNYNIIPKKMSKQDIADNVQDWLYAHLPPELEWCPNVENGNCETITNEAFARMVKDQLITMMQDLA